ncbi:histidine kinase [Nonomuraea sp. NPDC005650]|uniref:sensor histidine kinase n=1 Tax=Nonomuraea sp. NPDC005650 TaxID=3157045 RepID=UPI0033AB7E2E
MRATVGQAARATLQLALSAWLAFASYLFVTVLLFTAVATLLLIGAATLPETVLLVRKIAGWKRQRTQAWTGQTIPEAYLPIEGRLRQRLRTVIHDPGTYTDLRWLVAHFIYGQLVWTAVPLWLVGLPIDGLWCGLMGRRAVVLPLIGRLADLDAAWSTTLLRPSPRVRLTARVEQLTATRAGAVAAHGAELRRIERDLHDGAQARLVSLSMRLGLAQRAWEHDPQTARKLLGEAQHQAETALAELRQVVREIHPPILTDRGLIGAVRALAASSGLDVRVGVDGMNDGVRAPAAVEAAAYYVVAEALTNAAKHSGSDTAEVQLVRAENGLKVLVRDEGRGGAEEVTSASCLENGASRSGLLGIHRRVAALDGIFAVTSPSGGPTLIEVKLPCVW